MTPEVEAAKIMTSGMNQAGMLQAGGTLLSSYMQSKAMEKAQEKELRFKREQFRHQQRIESAQLNMQRKQNDQQLAQSETQFSRYLRDDAQKQANYSSVLSGLGA